MSRVRVLIGTRKGAFVLTADGKRERWDVSGPHFGGWEIYHLEGIARRPESTLRVAVEQLVRPGDPALQRRRQDLGDGRQQVRLRRRRRQPSLVRRHAAPLGVRARLASRAVADRSRHRLRGHPGRRAVPHDRRRPDVAASSPGCATIASAPQWQPGAGGMCLHTILLDPSHPGRIFIAISAAGVFRSDDAGETWRPMNRGLVSEQIPESHGRGRPLRASDRDASVASERAVHAEALGRHAQRRRRRVLAGGQREPADRLRLPDRRARARAEHRLRRPDQERLRALSARRQAARVPQPHRRPRVGSADERAAAEPLLRQRAPRRDGRRLARSVRRLLRHHRRAGVRVGRCGRQLGADRPRSAVRGVRSRSRRCHDPGRAPGASADARARRRAR